MGGSAHEHMEHAEHTKHHANDPFDRMVALSIAIIAAVLATVTMLSHRAHNATLQVQGEANRLVTDANIDHTQSTDYWALYQAHNIRRHHYETSLEMAAILTPQPGSEAQRKAAMERWNAQLAQYRTDLPEDRKKAEGFAESAKKKMAEAQEKLAESHAVHAFALRYDLAELAVELGLVLCSVAVLTKRKTFWFSGVASAAVGVLVASSVVYWPPHVDHGPKTEKSSGAGQY